MRAIQSGLAGHLAGGATTLCMCWKAERQDGTIVGFTDHDRQLEFGGVTFNQLAGPTPSAVEAGPGLAVGGHEISGGFSLDGLSETELRAGRWDNARVEFWMVNWKNVAQRLLVGVGNIGEVASEDGTYRAEVRSLSHLLDQPKGRIFSHLCDADLGDGRCGINLTNASNQGSGTVTETDGRRYVVASGLGGFDDGWFSRGKLTWTSGNNDGAVSEIKTHMKSGSVTLWLWQATGAEIGNGDTFTISAGCDKRFETCREKFDNAAEFRGFPHIPGNDFALSYPSPEEDHDGGKRS